MLDVIVIGSGPGGYVCAIRAAQLGLKVAIVEKDPTLGGTCLNVGCIPSKALLESSERYEQAAHGLAAHGVVVEGTVGFDLPTMLQRKDHIVRDLTDGVRYLMDKNSVSVHQGHGRLAAAGEVIVTDPDGAETTLAGEHIVLATGSTATPLRGLPFDGDRIVTSTEALSFSEVPEHLIVVGAGVIGLELGSVWRRLGAKVTVLEYLDRILAGSDNDVAREAQRTFARQGMTFVLGARVTAAQIDGSTASVSYTDAAGAEQRVEGDRVLVAVGRRPYTAELGCEAAGVALDERGFVTVDAHLQTAAANVYAIGDLIRGPMLAHKAEDEGVMVAERIAGKGGHVNYDAIPSIVYTHPEIASVGKTESELQDAGIPFRKGRFRYAANGRAKALGETGGFVKMLAHAETDRLLGCHIIGARAGDMIAEVALAMEFHASAEDVARSVHAHPTLSEIVREAALDVERRSLHK